MQAPSPKWYSGFISNWFKETALSSISIPLCLMTPIALMTIGVDAKPTNDEFLNTTHNMTALTSMLTWVLLSWQCARLKAIEWSSLVPNYHSHLIKQGVVILFGIHFTLFGFAYLNEQPIDIYASIAFGSLTGSLYLAFCIKTLKALQYWPMLFIVSTIVYFLPPEFYSQFAYPIIIAALLSSSFVTVKPIKLRWEGNGLAILKKVSNQGMLSFDFLEKTNLFTLFSKHFYTLMLFSGPLTVLTTVVYIALLPVVCIVAIQLNWPDAILFYSVMGISFIAGYLGWAKIQIKKHSETLLLLPAYRTFKDIKQALTIDFMKLSFLLVGLSALAETVLSFSLGNSYQYLTLLIFGSLSGFYITLAICYVTNKLMVFHFGLLLLPLSVGVAAGAELTVSPSIVAGLLVVSFVIFKVRIAKLKLNI